MMMRRESRDTLPLLMKQQPESLIRSSAVSSHRKDTNVPVFDDRQFSEALTDIAFTDTAVKEKAKSPGHEQVPQP